MKKKTVLIVFMLATFAFSLFERQIQNLRHQNVADVLFELGEKRPSHYLEDISEVEVKMGYDLIHFGRTRMANGKYSRYISKFYKCTSCHNVVREDSNLEHINQEERLKYALENEIPYLQGSTFWGMVNRESWYNDDYVIKYGSLVEKAKNSLIESTQLCAQVCSQGRELEEWELESILAYYWSLQLKMSDLNFTDKEYKIIEAGTDKDLIGLIKSKYLQKSPATFKYPPQNKSKGYEIQGDPKKGKDIYEISCQHCHRENGESDVVLDNERSTLRWLKKNITKDSKLSIYEIIRNGTYSELGHKEYMPLYTEEKMSNSQIEDLRSFIESLGEID